VSGGAGYGFVQLVEVVDALDGCVFEEFDGNLGAGNSVSVSVMWSKVDDAEKFAQLREFGLATADADVGCETHRVEGPKFGKFNAGKCAFGAQHPDVEADVVGDDDRFFTGVGLECAEDDVGEVSEGCFAGDVVVGDVVDRLGFGVDGDARVDEVVAAGTNRSVAADDVCDGNGTPRATVFRGCCFEVDDDEPNPSPQCCGSCCDEGTLVVIDDGHVSPRCVAMVESRVASRSDE
jgi:hypothetical protein